MCAVGKVKNILGNIEDVRSKLHNYLIINGKTCGKYWGVY